jgi:hypothetical protein
MGRGVGLGGWFRELLLAMGRNLLVTSEQLSRTLHEQAHARATLPLQTHQPVNRIVTRQDMPCAPAERAAAACRCRVTAQHSSCGRPLIGAAALRCKLAAAPSRAAARRVRGRAAASCRHRHTAGSRRRAALGTRLRVE